MNSTPFTVICFAFHCRCLFPSPLLSPDRTRQLCIYCYTVTTTLRLKPAQGGPRSRPKDHYPPPPYDPLLFHFVQVFSRNKPQHRETRNTRVGHQRSLVALVWPCTIATHLKYSNIQKHARSLTLRAPISCPSLLPRNLFGVDLSSPVDNLRPSDPNSLANVSIQGGVSTPLPHDGNVRTVCVDHHGTIPKVEATPSVLFKGGPMQYRACKTAHSVRVRVSSNLYYLFVSRTSEVHHRQKSD